MKKTGENQEDLKQLLREFEENPYDPANKIPEDIMRIFYQHDLQILPVISNRNILLGIIRRDKIVSEMSDLERIKNTNIDDFILKIANKMSLDDILPFVTDTKEFLTINIFGEIQKSWSRIELMAACENVKLHNADNVKNEIDWEKEKQTMEWMIYLILEHIPRPLYALNVNGKTIFYNSYFEDLYLKNMRSTDVDIDFLEKSINDAKKNEYHFKEGRKKDIYFYNKELDIFYEKIPMHGKSKLLGYLVYCGKSDNVSSESINVDTDSSLKDKMFEYERQIIVDYIHKFSGNLEEVSKNLKLNKLTLSNKIKKHNITIKK